jgi:hypothetical protein
MLGLDKIADEFFVMLKQAEAGMENNTKQVLLVNKTTSFKKKGKSNKKSNGAGSTVSQKRNMGGATTKTECFYCKAKEHWKRNCKKYLADKKKNGSSSKGIKVIQINVIDILLASNTCMSWVFNTGSVAHICNTMQGL